VPPKCLYEKGTPLLISVPCCEPCNNKFSKDDDFFKTIMVFVAGDANPVSKLHLDGSVKRAMKRLVIGLSGKVAAQLEKFQVTTKSGLYTGQEVAALGITGEDWLRISKTLIRIVRGLRYDSTKGAKRYDNHAYSLLPLENEDRERVLKSKGLIEAIKKNKTIGIVDDRVCKIKIIPVEGSEEEHIWILEFYERMQFLVVVRTMERAKRVMEKKNEPFLLFGADGRPIRTTTLSGD
jgi:hypothetical protein